MSVSPMPVTSLPELLYAWYGGLRSVAALGRTLTDEQWDAPTECPGWSCGDIVAHLSSVEERLAGYPPPQHEVDWGARPHITTDFGRFTEVGVDVRRGRDHAELCAELDALSDERLAQLGALKDLDLGTEVMGVWGRPVPLERMLRIRVFDTWAHEQDIRRGAGLPGDLDNLAARISAAQILSAVPFVWAKGVGAPPGSTLSVDVTGPVEFSATVAVGEDGRGVPVAAVPAPDVALATDWETFHRLAAGRLDVGSASVRSRVHTAGDAATVDRLLAELAITP